MSIYSIKLPEEAKELANRLADMQGRKIGPAVVIAIREAIAREEQKIRRAS